MQSENRSFLEFIDSTRKAVSICIGQMSQDAEKDSRYSKKQAAAMVGVTQESIRNWERNGLLGQHRPYQKRIYNQALLNRMYVIRLLLEKQLKSIFNQLHEEQTRLVTIELVDRDIEKVVQEINALLERIQQTAIKSNASSVMLKSSIVDISHDMKTPLTSVIGYLQLAEKECEDENTGELIKTCLERTYNLNVLINDFFELSVIESQGCTPKMEGVDVAGMVCEQILAYYPVFEEKIIQ